MTVALVWAQARALDGGPAIIGAGGALPWHLPADLAHFRALTTGRPVLMGRLTWESLPARFRPLPGRTNLVLSRRPGFEAPGAVVVPDLGAALALADDGAGEVWIIGGAQLYAATIDRAHRLEVTEIDLDLDGDARAPAIGAGWHRDATAWHTLDAGPRYRFVTYTRAPRPEPPRA
ncbi:dihydrofolate reductase [Pengzhenrongella sicca]|uniref:Dihydrofolate reductase n=1 Tax=Pengzhenrongella sicca TaxID=2819238 RepID=A0A8A4ZF29_9MICO|nr:dihydrofolate reductase [Pengzhenrongella sicca]QTE30600.1 dihydrofolate reductase [Pengzhenrongella sicca]